MIANHRSVPERDKTTLSKENNQINNQFINMISNVKEIFEYFF